MNMQGFGISRPLRHRERSAAIHDPMAKEHRPAAIVTDLNMPVMDGFTMTQAIRSDALLDPTPIIMLTMPSEPEDLVRGLNTGADGYLTKPYQVSSLVSRLESLLANPPSPPPKTERRVADIATVIGAGKTS